ncbi:MAG TPA: RDD family protein [Acidobacteriota bacterium]|nr:RDD family protein [Acidobacteriota bacterium]
MLCTRCKVPIKAGRCPRCGAVTSSGDDGEHKKGRRSLPIQFDVSTSSQAEAAKGDPNWRSGLKQAVEGKASQQLDTEAETVPDSGIAFPAPKQESDSSIFDYRLRDSSPEQKAPSTSSNPNLNAPVSRKPQALEKTLSRPATAPQEPRKNAGTHQKRLDLTPLPHRTTPIPSSSKPTLTAEAERNAAKQSQLSREILFSRFLAGIIDLTLPLGLALIFTLATARVLVFDLFETHTVTLILAFAATFFFFNSMFFLLSSGRTPGMYFTDLELRNADGTQQVTPSLVLLRVLFFVPTVLSVFGLIWAVFDPSRRCLHDHLSGTQIMPVND